MSIRPIWMDRERCEYPPVFFGGVLVGLAVGLALASAYWWEILR